MRASRSSPLQAGLQLLALQPGVADVTEQRVDDFLILLQQGSVCRGMNDLVKISQLLRESARGEQTVVSTSEEVSVFSLLLPHPETVQYQILVRLSGTVFTQPSVSSYSS